jgi:hypothetical protein
MKIFADTARPPFGRKLSQFFLFFCLGRDPLGTCDKPLTGFKFTRLWGRKKLPQWKVFFREKYLR